jgi:hypothetical protein
MRRCILPALEIHAQKSGNKSCGGRVAEGRLTARERGREIRGGDREEPSVGFSFFFYEAIKKKERDKSPVLPPCRLDVKAPAPRAGWPLYTCVEKGGPKNAALLIIHVLFKREAARMIPAIAGLRPES